jgi:hypothetical protein
VRLVNTYPFLAPVLAELGGYVLPRHDVLFAGPVTHELKDGSAIKGDATVRMTKGGQPAYFAQVEVQQQYSLGKYTTLHAYHGKRLTWNDSSNPTARSRNAHSRPP